jgi:hypothetical protein
MWTTAPTIGSRARLKIIGGKHRLDFAPDGSVGPVSGLVWTRGDGDPAMTSCRVFVPLGTSVTDLHLTGLAPGQTDVAPGTWHDVSLGDTAATRFECYVSTTALPRPTHVWLHFDFDGAPADASADAGGLPGPGDASLPSASLLRRAFA